MFVTDEFLILLSDNTDEALIRDCPKVDRKLADPLLLFVIHISTLLRQTIF